MTDAPGASSGSAFLNRKNHALDVDRQQIVYMLGRDFAQAGPTADTGVCEQDVYFSLLVLDLAIRRSRSSGLDTSPCTAVTLLPM